MARRSRSRAFVLPRRFRSSVAARPAGRVGLPSREDPKPVVTGAVGATEVVTIVPVVGASLQRLRQSCSVVPVR